MPHREGQGRLIAPDLKGSLGRAKADRDHGLRIERAPGPWVAEGISRATWYRRTGQQRGRITSKDHANRFRAAARELGRTYRAVMAQAQFLGAPLRPTE